MNKPYAMIAVLILLLATLGCAKEKRFHPTALPDPASFNAHFGDIDADDDGWLNWEEFKAYFPKATPSIFEALDLSKDKQVDHDEWHAFKEAHGMRGHD